MTNRPWPEVADNPVLFSIFSLIASLKLKFHSLKIFFKHFENCTDSVVRNTDVFLHECDFALMQIESKYDMERSWDKKNFEEVSNKKQYQVFQFEASKRNICIAVHEKVNYLPTVWKTMPSCTKVHIKHKYKWNNVQCSSCFKVFTKKLCQDHLKYIL